MNFRTLVVGTGYLGRRFLDQTDNEARGLTRTDYDLDTGGPLPVELPSDYKVLFTVPPAGDSDGDPRLETLLDVLTPAPRRFVYISTTGVYGDHGGGVVNEETPVNPGSGHAARRVAAEQTLTAWAQDSGTAVVILRVPGIYGPGRLGLDRIRKQVPILRDEDTGPGNRIHVDDLVTCCAAALDDRMPAGICNVGDGDHRSSTWFANEVARQAGLPAPPTVTMAEAEQQFSPMRLSFLRDRRRVETRKMRETLGVSVRYPNAERGITASL